jgi:non-ribosomal peptide synthetase component F
MITDSPLSTTPEAKLVPASFAQARLWFLNRLDPERSDYNVTVGWRIEGTLDVALLRDAMQIVVDRHEILRTTFVDVDGAPWQRISASFRLEVSVCDLRSVPAPMRERELERCLAEEVSRPFDLALGPLTRMTVYRIDEDASALILAKHHTICGGDSGKITTYELALAYNALAAGEEPRLPAVETQHADYTAWQHEQLTPEREAALVAYWRDRLAGAPPSLALPTDFHRPRVRSSAGSWATFRIDHELVRALRALADAAGVTLHMTLLAAFQVLLGRHAEQDDVLVGSPVSARARGQFRNLMGFLVNVVVHRGDLTDDPTFREFLARTLASARAAYAHRDLPLERVIESVPVKRDPGRNPLFQVMFTMQEADSSPLDLGGLRCEPIRLRNAAAKVDLSLLLYSDDHGFAGELEYSTDLFAAPTIERMAAQYVELLEQVVRDPDRPLSQLPLVSAEEQRRIVVDWNDTTSAYPAGRSIPQLFIEQARRAPDAVAVSDGSRSLTYGALERRAIELARRLCEQGIAGAARVGVCIERSQEEIVAFLGILLAGCTYVPLDPSHPPERLAAILDEAGATGLVTTSETPPALAEALARSRCPVVVIDDGAPVPDAGRVFELPQALDDALAYVMYTSGSTGTPKGVAIPHRAIARLVCGTDYVQLGPADTVAHLSNPAFDAATFEIWGPLLNGGRIAVIPRDAVMSVHSLPDALDRHSVSALFLTTALFNQVAQDVPSALRGRVVLFGGEPAERGACRLRCARAGRHACFTCTVRPKRRRSRRGTKCAPCIPMPRRCRLVDRSPIQRSTCSTPGARRSRPGSPEKFTSADRASLPDTWRNRRLLPSDSWPIPSPRRRAHVCIAPGTMPG